MSKFTITNYEQKKMLSDSLLKSWKIYTLICSIDSKRWCVIIEPTNDKKDKSHIKLSEITEFFKVRYKSEKRYGKLAN